MVISLLLRSAAHTFGDAHVITELESKLVAAYKEIIVDNVEICFNIGLYS